MLIEKMDKKVKCDASGCKSLADYKIVNKRITFNGSMYFCLDCLEELKCQLDRIVIPKSPSPIFKKKTREFKEYNLFDLNTNDESNKKLEKGAVNE